MSAKSNLSKTLKKNDSIFFSMTYSEKGEEIIDSLDYPDVENMDDLADSGNFKAVEINITNASDIKGFDKIADDPKAWEFKLPISSLSVSDISEKNFENLIKTLGQNINDLDLDYNSFKKLNLSIVCKHCPQLKKLTLKDTNSWNRETPLEVNLNELNELPLLSLDVQNYFSKSKVDLSSLPVEKLDFSQIDINKIVLPKKVKDLRLDISFGSLKKSKVDLTYLENIDCIDLSASNDGELKEVELQLPTALKKIRIVTADFLGLNLNCLANIPNLNHLELVTSVRNFQVGFKGLDVLSNLNHLIGLKLVEDGLGVNNYKSEFKSKLLENLTQLEELELNGMLNFEDFKSLSKLNKLRSITIHTSKLNSLNGIEKLTSLDTLKLIDCHYLHDLQPLTNSSVQNFEYYISSAWGTEVKMTPKDFIKLEKAVNLKKASIGIERKKFVKKDFKSLEKLFEVDVDGETLTLYAK